MAWKNIHSFFNIIGVHGFWEYNHQWIFRGFDSVFCIDPRKMNIVWDTEFSHDHSFGYKPLFPLNDFVLTSMHHMKPDAISLVCLASKSGEIRWEKKINWTLNQNMGGVMIDDRGRILLFENVKSPDLVVLDRVDGSEITRKSGLHVIESGKYQKGPFSAIIMERTIFCCVSTDDDEGFYRMDLNTEPCSILKIVEGKCLIVDSIGDEVICLMIDEDHNKIFRIQASDGSIMDSFKLPKYRDVLQIVPSHKMKENNKNSVLLCFDEYGIADFDLEKGKNNWSLGHEQEWNAIDVTLTPVGVVVLFDTSDGSIICTINYSNGKIISSSKFDDTLRGKMFWTGSNLVYCSSKGLEIFEWVN